MAKADKRSLNRELRALAVTANSKKCKLDVELLRRSSRLAKSIRDIPEAIIDSNLALIVTAEAREITSKLALTGVSYSPSEFADRLNDLIKVPGTSTEKTRFRFDILSAMVRDRSSFGKTCVIGSFKLDELEESRVRRRMQVTQKPPGEKTLVQELTAENREQEQTTKQVDRIYHALQKLYDRGHQVVDFYEFVTDPQSFSETIENIFYVSFLIAQRLATLELDADGMPCLAYVARVEAGTEESSRKTVTGLTPIISMSVTEWKQVIETYQIKRGVIQRLLGNKPT